MEAQTHNGGRRITRAGFGVTKEDWEDFCNVGKASEDEWVATGNKLREPECVWPSVVCRRRGLVALFTVVSLYPLTLTVTRSTNLLIIDKSTNIGIRIYCMLMVSVLQARV